MTDRDNIATLLGILLDFDEQLSADAIEEITRIEATLDPSPKRFYITQDGGSDATPLTREEAAEAVDAISDALRNDANKFERMAKAIREGSEDNFEYHGAYLSLCVNP